MKISWTQSIGSALGAVSSAVLLSTLGVAGTLIGAALGSLVITIGGALYSRSLQVTKERVLQTADRARSSRSGPDGVPPDFQDDDAPSPPVGEDTAPVAVSWQRRLRTLPWKRVLGTGAAVFAIAMALILAFELTTGRPVSSYTGGSSKTDSGTSIPGFGGSPGSGTDEESPRPEGPQEDTTQDPQQDGTNQDEATPDETSEDPVTPGPGVPTPPQEEAPQAPQPQDDAPQQDPPADVAPGPQQQDDPG